MWWQYVTGMLVHKEVPHFLGNLLGYILIFSLLLIFSIKSKKKHSLFPAFLILTTIVIMVRISFYDLIFKEHEMLGSSEIIYGLIGLIPAYCPIHLKKGLNKYLPWLLVIILLFAFHVCTSINSEEIADIPHFIGIICGIISGFLVVNIKEIKKWTKRTMWK
jgi:membrane associated rhomboid family serine protease